MTYINQYTNLMKSPQFDKNPPVLQCSLTASKGPIVESHIVSAAVMSILHPGRMS